MSKFLTPPSWYDKNGSEINIFDNTTYEANGPFNTAIGRSAVAGRSLGQGSGFGAVAVGSQAHATGPNSIAIGSYDETSGGSSRNVEALASGSIAIGGGAKANADSTDGIAIGRGATSGQGGIAIGAGADAIADQIQLGNNNTAYTLNVGNGDVSIGNFEITPIKNGDYANQVVLGNINQIKAPMAGISFEVGERRETGTIIFPSKIKTLMVDSIQYSVGAISKTSTNGSLNLSANCLYVINFGSFRAMLHTTTNNSNTHQFIYSIDSTTDYVIYVNNVLSDTTLVTCKLQKYNKSNNTYTDYTDSNFTAIKVCSFT